MMRMNETLLVFALILMMGGAAAKNRSLKIDAVEDELFWVRKLQDSSMSVTLPPALPPIPPPTLPPRLPPNLPPMASEECLVEVTISCTDSQGTDCNAIQPPPGQCADGTDIQNVRFKYTALSCEADANSQRPQDGFACQDFNGGFPAGTVVLITCADGPSMDSNVLASEIVTMPGNETTVPSLLDVTGPLPQVIACVVSSTDGVTQYQRVTINTSGNAGFFLKDTFGSLQVESCDANDCTKSVGYTYKLVNIGGTPMTITKLVHLRDGATLDFLPALQPKTLAVGQTTSVTEGERIDVCVDSTSTTTVRAEANPPVGVPCLDAETYNLITKSLPRPSPPTLSPTTPSPPPTLSPTTPPPPPTLRPTTSPGPTCELDISITCSVLGEGIECSNFQAPADRCQQDNVYVYTFRNNGTVPLTITAATSMITGGKFTGGDLLDLISLITPTTLQPGEATRLFQVESVDYCQTEPITSTVKAQADADPGGCMAETTNGFTPSRRRTLRGS